MVSIIRYYFPLNTLFLVALDSVCLFFAILIGYMLLYPGGSVALVNSIPGALVIVLSMVALTGALGLYRTNAPDHFWPIVTRVALAFLVVLPGLHWIFYKLPDGSICIPCLAGTMLLGFGGKVAIFLFSRVSPLSHRRVLILGVGSDAVAVKETLDSSQIRGLSVVGFYSPYADQVVDASVPVSDILPSSKSIGDTTGQHNVSEIVIAMRERRGGSLPLTELLNCKLRGIKVTDLSSFFEQHRSKVRIDLLRESWFIFGDGFRQGKLRMFVKRTFDIVASGVLLVLGFPVMLAAALAVKLDSAGPIIYRQERVGLAGRKFNILKFRSMHTDAEKDGKAKCPNRNPACHAKSVTILADTFSSNFGFANKYTNTMPSIEYVQIEKPMNAKIHGLFKLSMSSATANLVPPIPREQNKIKSEGQIEVDDS